MKFKNISDCQNKTDNFSKTHGSFITLNMEEKVLSASELLQDKNASGALPSFGTKKAACSGDEGFETQNRLENLKTCLSAPRVIQRSQVSEAEFKNGQIYVTRNVGKHFDIIGHMEDQHLVLNPEEALFLLETNSIIIRLNELPMSMQQAYTLFLGQDCSMSEYRTYSNLMKQGYKVIRHQGDLGITKYGRQINLDKHLLKDKRNKRPLQDLDIIEDDEEEDDLSGPTPVKLPRGNSLSIIHEEVVILSNSPPASPEIQILEEHSDDEVQIVNTKKEALAGLPNLFGRSKINLKTPKTELLPFRAWPSKREYTLNVDTIITAESTSKVARVKEKTEAEILIEDEQDDDNEMSNDNLSRDLLENCDVLNPLHSNKDRPKGKATAGQSVKNTNLMIERHNRGYYPEMQIYVNTNHQRMVKWKSANGKNKAPPPKEKLPEVVTIDDDDPYAELKEGPLKSLWVGKTCPMIMPSQGTSTKDILTLLRMDQFQDKDNEKDNGRKFKISYDIYGPKAPFKKSKPSLPTFRIVIVEAKDEVPNKNDLSATLGSISDGVPLVFSVVSNGDISFYSLYPVDLPLQITMG